MKKKPVILQPYYRKKWERRMKAIQAGAFLQPLLQSFAALEVQLHHVINQNTSVQTQLLTLSMKLLLYLPVYNAHPHFEACFQEKSVSTSFLTKTNFLEKFSRNAKSSSTCTKISYRSWCKSFNVLSVQWYIKFYDVFFVFFCCFAAARLNMLPVTCLWMRSPGTRLAATW